MNWYQLIREDFSVVFERDPATRSRIAVLTLHTDFWAVAFYRMQHALWNLGLRWLPRWLSLVSRWMTGVEIHPAVVAGRRLFIDHGMGVVIGETAILGDDVSIYQGVTLGGTTWSEGRRHPSVGSNVILGAGAKVLGTVHVGDHARVGSNAVVVKEVEPYTTVVGVPARAVRLRHEEGEQFSAYGLSHEVIPDPIITMLEQLSARVAKLEAENAALRQRHD